MPKNKLLTIDAFNVANVLFIISVFLSFLIKPISLSNDDTVSNGFALCPNLHCAFDRGIIGVDEQYRVVVSRHIKEEATVSYSLKALEGTKLYLPMPEVHYPRVENFLRHLGARFEK
jgi:putative restriction endonuclease